MAEIMKNLKAKKIVNYDAKSDVLYLGVKRGAEEEFIEISPGINIELDENGQVIGVEILNASRVLRPIVKPLQKQVLLWKGFYPKSYQDEMKKAHKVISEGKFWF